MTPPNVFVIRVLHRFGLANWAQPGFENRQANDDVRISAVEDFSKMSTVAAEEMLQLLIMIIGNVYFAIAWKYKKIVSGKLKKISYWCEMITRYELDFI